MLSEVIKDLRKRKKITQARLAEQLGISQQAVANWEKGLANPSTDMLKILSDYFNVSTDYLLGNDEKQPLVFNEEELQLVSGYRELSEANRSVISRIMSAFLTQQSATTFSNFVQNNNCNGNFFGGSNYGQL